MWPQTRLGPQVKTSGLAQGWPAVHICRIHSFISCNLLCLSGLPFLLKMWTIHLLAWTPFQILVPISGLVCCQNLVFHLLTFFSQGAGWAAVFETTSWPHVSLLETHLLLRPWVFSQWGVSVCPGTFGNPSLPLSPGSAFSQLPSLQG